MKLFSLEITAALRVTLLLGLVFAAPHLAMAGDEKEGGQQGAAQGNAQPGDTSQSPSSSTDVQERGLPLGAGPRPGSAVIQPPPAPFKCSAATLKCRCYGVSDCNWMRRVIGEYCSISDSCAQNCECKISK